VVRFDPSRAHFGFLGFGEFTPDSLGTASSALGKQPCFRELSPASMNPIHASTHASIQASKPPGISTTHSATPESTPGLIGLHFRSRTP
jgi:hypothetical protein